MQIRVLGSYEEMSVATATFISSYVNSNPECLICLPSGDTPTRTLQLLVDYTQSGKVNFDKCRFVGLDEWVGMDKTIEGSCQHYIYNNFFYPLNIPQDHIRIFNATAVDLDDECRKMDEYIFSKGGIDLALVGVGMNGHIGLNEPGTSSQLYAHHVQLEDSTIKVAQKYFNTNKTLSRGITLGLKHLMETECLIVVANGAKKSGIIRKLVTGEITEQVPGSILQQHSNCNLFLDENAASEIDVSI